MAIVPQLRRQLPEHWRRVDADAGRRRPLRRSARARLHHLRPHLRRLRAGGRSRFAVGDPAIGLAIGLAFGFGRALPIVALAPVADRPSGRRVTELMADRPAIYRGLRFGDGLALLAAAAALVATVPASASQTDARARRRPLRGWQGPRLPATERPRLLDRGPRQPVALAGTDPAIGDGSVAVRRRRRDRDPLGEESRAASGGCPPRAPTRSRSPAAGSPGGRDRRATTSCTRATSPTRRSPGPTTCSARRASAAARTSEPGRQPRRVRARDRDQQRDRQTRAWHEEGRQLGPDALRPSTDSRTRRCTAVAALRARHGARRQARAESVGGHGDGRTLLSRRHGTLWSTALSATSAPTSPRSRVRSRASGSSPSAADRPHAAGQGAAKTDGGTSAMPTAR